MVLFGDESGIRADHHAGTTWAPELQPPVVKATGVRYGLDMLSAISATKQLGFMTMEGRVNGAAFAAALLPRAHACAGRPRRRCGGVAVIEGRTTNGPLRLNACRARQRCRPQAPSLSREHRQRVPRCSAC
ncbi:transposase [Azohydromonas lata]|uniref:transposase n=1 Tax=Azohydromonas lata TaxID=45677 RepID=UPI0035A25DDC